MSQALAALRALITPGTSKTVGVVSKVDTTSLVVATQRGITVVTKGSGTQFQVGDEVVLEGGQVLGKVRKAEELPVYFV